MAHPYVQEQAARTEYIITAAESLVERLDSPQVIRTLGEPLREHMRVMAESVYCPEVSGDGAAHLTLHQIHDNAVPVLALKPDEQLVRDVHFSSFTPEQLEHADDPNYLYAIAGRMAQDGGAPQDIAVTGLIGKSFARRLIYRMDAKPDQGHMTLFNLRPLVVLDYRKAQQPSVAARQLACALRHARFIVENTKVILPNEQNPDALEQQWRLQSQQDAATIIEKSRR